MNIFLKKIEIIQQEFKRNFCTPFSSSKEINTDKHFSYEFFYPTSPRVSLQMTLRVKNKFFDVRMWFNATNGLVIRVTLQVLVFQSIIILTAQKLKKQVCCGHKICNFYSDYIFPQDLGGSKQIGKVKINIWRYNAIYHDQLVNRAIYSTNYIRIA